VVADGGAADGARVTKQLDMFGTPERDTDRTHNYRCNTCGRRGHNARKCPDEAGQRPSIDQRWAEFHQTNPHVLDEMLRLARARVATGATRIGVKALWEELRSWLQVTGRGEYKLNNSFTAPAARALIERDPSLAAVIELRTRKAKANAR
jgi:hypothetical protein